MDRISDNDPPDEIIPRQPLHDRTVSSTLTYNQDTRTSMLRQIVAAVQSNSSIKARVAVALICGVLVTLYVKLSGSLLSYIVFMAAVDGLLYVVIFLLVLPDTNVNPLGWLELVKVPLSFFHPLLATLFENVFLCLYLLAYFIQDMLIMLFIAVLSMSVVQLQLLY